MIFFFFKQKTAYEIRLSLVGSEMCIRDSTRIMLWVVVATALPVTLLTYAQHQATTSRTLRDGSAQELSTLTRTLALGLSGRIDESGLADTDALIEAVGQHASVTQIHVTDEQGQLLRDHTDPSMPSAAFDDLPLAVGKAMPLDERGERLACRHAVWSTPVPGPDRRLEGYVTVVMFHPRVGTPMGGLGTVEWAVAGFWVALVAVAVWFASRRMTRSLRQLLDATDRLTRHQEAPVLPTHDRDEIGLLGGTFNVMAQRLAEAHRDLQAHNENLEQLVAERTIKLEEANQHLADQIADKDAFLRSISHDLNAPLRNIDGMAAMVLRKHRETLDDDVVRKLERICANVKQQSELINELVVLNRQRAKPNDAGLIDLNALVQEVFDGLGHEFEQGRIDASIEGTLPTIRAERTRVRQIFQNLIDNAAKYMMDSPRRQIVVRAEEDLDFYGFSVADTRRGIAWEDQPKVFGVFQRATHSGTHGVQGKGVGLASVKAIVEGYGGQIWLESELGQGSTFHFTLDRERASPPLDPVTSTRSS